MILFSAGRGFRLLAALGILLFQGRELCAYAIASGTTREAVIQAYGHPRSVARLGDREILTYPEGSITLENGRVTDFRFTRGEPRLLKPASLRAIAEIGKGSRLNSQQGEVGG